jgi:hypothetical protein
MKKLFVAISAFLYITASTGITVHMHYCMGKQESRGLVKNHASKCGKCGMIETEKGCCKDENKFFKNDSDQKTAGSVFQLMPLVTVTLLPSFVEINAGCFAAVTKDYPVIHTPPRTDGVAVYIRNCVFLI